MRALLISVGLLALFGCQQEIASERAELETLEPTVANMKLLVGKPKASDIGHCKLLRVGEKACGGPEQYLIYSTETVADEKQLLSLVNEYNRLSRERKQGQFSTCEFIPRPKVRLVGGMCKAE